ncbi:single-stranded DNA-binding protein [Streptomyces sp. XD-27]|uniref:single-stranded DNA-binding protein n=1 Tax=Streptomyces sp. XD-27 TaxID=3062779 RepID=UPI0026F42021|nr:single-stranded DNA-binding protein [Streptomyces sp. XD-27]WKX70365.1 single-stranded DNA-binding protein [Streptomyces sp. XD-27]
MNETLVTLVGNVATRPEFRETASGVPVTRFRLAVTARRWDRAREVWQDAYTSFYTVWAWRSLAVNVAASVTIGEPVVVQGRLRVREEWREPRDTPQPGGAQVPASVPAPVPVPVPASVPRDPQEPAGARGHESDRRVSVEIDALAVGHDLARGTAAFRRVSQAKPQLTGATAP